MARRHSELVATAASRPLSGARTKASFWDKNKRGFSAYLFMLPYLLIFFAFQFLPALSGAGISLTNWRILGTPKFIGLENYDYVLHDDMFWNALGNTLKFTLYTVVPMVVGGLLLAVMLNARPRGHTITRTAIFLPYAIMIAVVGILWQWIYDQNFGLANYYLTCLFPMQPIPWLSSTQWALIALAITTIWWQIGTNMVIYLARSAASHSRTIT
jgi:multiple sugar transport system permease protein